MKNIIMLPLLVQYPVVIIRTFLLMLLCFVASACTSSGEIPSNTQLAVSPGGNRIVVSWNDRTGSFYAKIVELEGSEVASIRDIALPAKTLTTAFGKSNDQLLVTTWDKRTSEFLKIDVTKKDGTKLIYKSQFPIRFPLEVSDEDYVFLEGQEKDSGLSKWQRYRSSEKSLLNDRPYRLATPLNVIDGSLFLLEPRTPPKLVILFGTVPEAVKTLLEDATSVLRCADLAPVTCLRSNTTIHTSSSFSTMAIFNGPQRCDIAGRWVDPSERLISRHGDTVVFQALTHLGGPRSVYFVRNRDQNCTVKTIPIKGE